VSYSLSVGSDAVMFSGREVDVRRTETREDCLNFVKAFFGGTVLYDDLAKVRSLQSGSKMCLLAVDLEDQHLGHGGNGRTQSRRLQEDVSQKLRFLELCKRFDHRQSHPALLLDIISALVRCGDLLHAYMDHIEQQPCQWKLLQHCRLYNRWLWRQDVHWGRFEFVSIKFLSTRCRIACTK
jgi:hypothetical protein